MKVDTFYFNVPNPRNWLHKYGRRVHKPPREDPPTGWVYILLGEVFYSKPHTKLFDYATVIIGHERPRKGFKQLENDEWYLVPRGLVCSVADVPFV